MPAKAADLRSGAGGRNTSSILTENEVTIVALVGPVTHDKAGSVLRRNRDAFGGPRVLVPARSIAEDRLLTVDQAEVGESANEAVKREANVLEAE
jgi:hypothetical protein